MAIDIDMTAVERVQEQLGDCRPIHVLNLLRFREEADYPNGTESAGRTGREAYFAGYVPAFGKVAQTQGVTGVRPVWIGDVVAALAVAPGEVWDTVVIVEYPSVEAFRRIVDSDAYRRFAEPLRKAALADWRLIAQTKAELPA